MTPSLPHAEGSSPARYLSVFYHVDSGGAKGLSSPPVCVQPPTPLFHALLFEGTQRGAETVIVLPVTHDVLGPRREVKKLALGICTAQDAVLWDSGEGGGSSPEIRKE